MPKLNLWKNQVKMNRMQSTHTSNHDVHIGELYRKPTVTGKADKIYHVRAVEKNKITLQNMDQPLSQFETTVEKLLQSGYVKLSETPYINLAAQNSLKAKQNKLKRCPYTQDLFAARADFERPLQPASTTLNVALDQA